MSRDYTDEEAAADVPFIKGLAGNPVMLRAVIARLERVIADDQRILSLPGASLSRPDDMDRYVEMGLAADNISLAQGYLNSQNS